MTSRDRRTPNYRRVLGRGRGGFQVTNRSTAGRDLIIESPTAPNRPNPPGTSPTPRSDGTPLPAFSSQPEFNTRYNYDPVSGYYELAAQQDALRQGAGQITSSGEYAGSFDGFEPGPARDFNPAAIPGQIVSGIFDKLNLGLPGNPDGQAGQWYGDEAENPFRSTDPDRGESGSSADERDPNQSVTRPSANDYSADDRMRDRVIRGMENAASPSKDEILASTQSAIAAFEVEKAMLEAQKQGALADGLEGVADQFDDQILAQEKAIQKMKDEIALTGDIEGWYRRRIQAPYEAAIKAAEEIDFQKTLAVQSKFRQEEAQSLAEMESRLEGVLGDIGFTPDQVEAMRGERALDNEVTAAQSALLEASGVRASELDWEKKLKASMAEEEWMRSNRQSSGREMIVAEQNRKAIGEAEDRIGELDNLKQRAMDRVRRAVDREFQGAEFPSKDEFVSSAMESMKNELYADLPPAMQEIYDSVWQTFAASGTPFTQANLTEMLANGQLEIPGLSDTLNQAYDELNDKWRTAYEAAKDAGAPLPAFPQDAWEETARAIVDENIDHEDRAIIKGMIDTYDASISEYGRYQEKRSTQNYSNAANTDPSNIADAKSGTGIYGERVRIVNNMVPVIQDLWGVANGGRVTEIQGQNYFRPSEDPEVERKKGRAVNSDHKTAGALDLFLDANDPQDVAYFRNVIEPQLRQWQNQGLIASYVPLGANFAHNDHTHVSFALPGMNDQGFDPIAGHDHTNTEQQAHSDSALNPFMGGM